MFLKFFPSFLQVHILVLCFEISDGYEGLIFGVLLMLLVFSFFLVYIFWHSFKLRGSFSFICFFKPLPRILIFLSVSNQLWFFLPLDMFDKDTFFCKEELFSENTLRSLPWKGSLLFSVSDILYPAAHSVFVIIGGKGELRKSLILVLFPFLLSLEAAHAFSWFSQTSP